MTKRERRQRIARMERWFVSAIAQERLLKRPKVYWAYMKTHPKAGLITAAMLYDLFVLAIDRDTK